MRKNVEKELHLVSLTEVSYASVFFSTFLRFQSNFCIGIWWKQLRWLRKGRYFSISFEVVLKELRIPHADVRGHFLFSHSHDTREPLHFDCRTKEMKPENVHNKLFKLCEPNLQERFRGDRQLQHVLKLVCFLSRGCAFFRLEFCDRGRRDEAAMLTLIFLLSLLQGKCHQRLFVLFVERYLCPICVPFVYFVCRKWESCHDHDVS